MILVIFCEFCSMPMLTTNRVGKSGKLGIWHITEPLDVLLEMKGFSKEDIAGLGSFAYEHRKKEWLVARIMTEELSGEKNIRIIYDEHSKPCLKNSKKHISLSHSHDLLAVILNESETGIDIELIKPKIANIKGKFMSNPELNSLQKENVAEQLTVYWCAKESLYKLYGKKELAFKENLVIEPFQYVGQGIIKGWIKNAVMNKRFSLHYETLNSGNDPYMLAYVID